MSLSWKKKSNFIALNRMLRMEKSIHLLIVYCITGIMVEGLGSLLDGLFGTGNGTTSTSINVGVVGLTKVSLPPTLHFYLYSLN